jgi:hypothetical protein
MSHTQRIYNRRLKKAQRFNIDDWEIHLFVGIPLTRRSWICMGRCKMCRDPNREPKLIRRRTREQFRLDLKSELDSVQNENDSDNENQLE